MKKNKRKTQKNAGTFVGFMWKVCGKTVEGSNRLPVQVMNCDAWIDKNERTANS